MTDWRAIDYRPRRPLTLDRSIAMVGVGSIAAMAARAYRAAGYRVVAVCDVDRARAEAFRDRFFPQATAYTDLEVLLAHEEAEVIDIATHTNVRPRLVRTALEAGRHVHSQKPFVEDISLGESLVRLAFERGLTLAVNQNARWAPQFAYLLTAVQQGALGRVASADFELHWDHDTPIRGTPFALMEDLLLLDFGIHWFDLVATVFADRTAERVYASTAKRSGQLTGVPTMATAIIDYPEGQATITLRGSAAHDDSGRYRVDGTQASLSADGTYLGGSTVEVIENLSVTSVPLAGTWMPDAMGGTMGELLLSLDQNREPVTSARRVLDSLRISFAAAWSARVGCPIDPATVNGPPPPGGTAG